MCFFLPVPAGPETLYIKVDRSATAIDGDQSLATEAQGVAVTGLGDEALWLGPAGELFVRKGNVALVFTDAGVASNALSDPAAADAAESRLVALAKQALTKR